MSTAPIAIVGMACRLPVGESPEQYWNSVLGGRDVIGAPPRERWARSGTQGAAIGDPASMHGGYLQNVEDFDAAFFGITPREALQMDPQQRLLVELAWEALEAAALPPSRLAGSPTGVFVGISSFDYYEKVLERPDRLDRYTLTGNAYSIAANRISYLLNLCGPSLTLDTACSSSLVAVHLACESLRRGESTLALAGGAHVMLSTSIAAACSKSGILSLEGRYRPFDMSANGYVRGEGAGLVALKPLDRAIAEDDPIYAVIRGTAVNHNGRSNGLVAPNPFQQQAAIETATRNAGIEPDSIDYVEAHASGTCLGDAMELQAIRAALRPGSSRPLIVSTGKSGIGHLEAAAGVTALVRAACAVANGIIPPTPHAPDPDGKRDPILIPRAPMAWVNGHPRVAGVNSFGFGGTNAHVVVEEPPPRKSREPTRPDADSLLLLSAKTDSALQSLAQRYAALLGDLAAKQCSAHDICYTAAVGREHFNHRAAVFGSMFEIQSGIRALAARTTAPNLLTGQTRRARPVALWFSDLCDCDLGLLDDALSVECVRTALSDCAAAANAFVRVSPGDLATLIATPVRSSKLDLIARFSTQVIVTRILRSWGAAVSVAGGRGLGVWTAAWAAGEKDLREALAGALECAARGTSSEDKRAAIPPLDNRKGEELVVEIGRGWTEGSQIPSASGTRGSLIRLAATLYAAGVCVDWRQWLWPGGCRRSRLPTYPFQRARFWVSDPPDEGRGSANSAAATDSGLEKLICRTMGIGREDLDADEPLISCGLDSLMCLELQRTAKCELDLDIAPARVLSGASLHDLMTWARSRSTEGEWEEGVI